MICSIVNQIKNKQKETINSYAQKQVFNEAWSNFFCLRFLNVFFYIIIILKLKKRHRPHRLFSGCFAIMALEGERGHHITKYLISTVFERGGIAIGLDNTLYIVQVIYKHFAYERQFSDKDVKSPDLWNFIAVCIYTITTQIFVYFHLNKQQQFD